MTCREKLRIEHPEGIANCPSAYEYLEDPDYCNDTWDVLKCVKCWDREIPEEKNQIVESKNKTLCDRCHSSGICKYSDELNSELRAIKSVPPFITIYVKCEYFNERKENI